MPGVNSLVLVATGSGLYPCHPCNPWLNGLGFGDRLRVLGLSLRVT
jgi:hypothetical protein